MQFETVTYRIKGMSGLLMNNPASMSVQEDAPKASKKKKPTAEEDAKIRAYKTEQGVLFIPAIAFRAALASAGKGRMFGPKVYATSTVKGAVFTAQDKCLLSHPETGESITDYEILTVRAVVQRASIPRSRPLIEKWGCDVTFDIDTEFVSPEAIEDLLGVAGRIIGVGDWRPEKSGPYGRFEVVAR